MTGSELRESVTAMVRLVAGAEEAALLGESASSRARLGSAQAWTLRATIAHNTEFKAQQVIRLKAAAERDTPPSFMEIDHSSAEVYQRFSEQSPEEVLSISRSTTQELLDRLWELPGAELTDPARNPWLQGRPLWLQVVVRGFWHPGGHLGEYWLTQGPAPRALRLHRSGVALAEAMELPGPALGMARYALACAEARTGHSEDALAELRAALEANPDLAQNADRDPDLETVRSLPGWASGTG
ncbi:MAG: hypothetical protein WCB86_05815 [Candidatus Dormiibacterota bacterium]